MDKCSRAYRILKQSKHVVSDSDTEIDNSCTDSDSDDSDRPPFVDSTHSGILTVFLILT